MKKNILIYPIIVSVLVLLLTTDCKKEEPALTVTDIDGNSYNTIRIGTQVWMKENLKTTKYNDGTPIPNITDNGIWAALTTGAYCNYDNILILSNTYGSLYNWYAVDNNAATMVVSNGGKNVCPTGWHVPSDGDWTTLTDYLTNNGFGYQGSGEDIGKSLAATSEWTSDPTKGDVGNDQASNNSSGFTALPGGYRNYLGRYFFIEYYGYWWSSTESSSDAWFRVIGYAFPHVVINSYPKQDGFSVRCLRD